MDLLLLTEGDAERWDSWSGSAKSLVDHLRVAGHGVTTADVDLYGFTRWLAAGVAFSNNRKRWGVRYHLGDHSYRLRSQQARRAVARVQAQVDCVLQIGATFEYDQKNAPPYALFCDSNINFALDGAQFGVSDAAWLTPTELLAIQQREARIYQNAAAVFTISEFLRRSFIDQFGVQEGRVFTVGAGPNLDLSRVPEPDPSPRGGSPTVLFVGKQFERKGGRILLDAFRIIRERMPNARLVIIGPTTPPASADGVEWIGNLDKNTPDGWSRLVEAYRNADVFCLPSLFEPFGIVILEAMFFGLPCIGTAAWAIPEMIEHGKTGYTVPRADSTALADSLTLLLENPVRARAMGMAGRRRAEETFTWTAVARRMIEGFEQAIAPPRH